MFFVYCILFSIPFLTLSYPLSTLCPLFHLSPSSIYPSIWPFSPSHFLRPIHNTHITGEKVTLGISILLSLVVFLLLVSKILPPTSLVLPLIAKYLLFTFLMNCISILATVIIINWNFRGPRTHKMPNWIRAVFLKYLPVVLLIKRPKKTRLRWMMEMPSLGVHYHPYRHSMSAGLPLGLPNGNNGAGPNGATSFPPDMGMRRGRETTDFTDALAPSSPSPTHHHHHHLYPHLSSQSSTLPPPPPHMSTSTLPQRAQMQPQPMSHHHHPHHHSPPPHHHHHLHQHALQQQHHPNCSAHTNGIRSSSCTNNNANSQQQQQQQQLDRCDAPSPPLPPITDDSIDTLYLTPEAYRATEAIEFIAEHLRSEDEYIQVSHFPILYSSNLSLSSCYYRFPSYHCRITFQSWLLRCLSCHLSLTVCLILSPWVDFTFWLRFSSLLSHGVWTSVSFLHDVSLIRPVISSFSPLHSFCLSVCLSVFLPLRLSVVFASLHLTSCLRVFTFLSFSSTFGL